MNARYMAACGDDLVTIAADGPVAAQEIARYLRASRRFSEVVAGIDSVVVQFDSANVSLSAALAYLKKALAVDLAGDGMLQELIEIPVVYGGEGGPDFDRLCKELGLEREEFIALHTRDEYRVDMLGFTPGFAYVGGLDDTLNVPRLAEPRVHVAAGSVGVAGRMTGLYALAGPGGWPIVGRTPMLLFDRDASDPFLLRPGMRVRFRAASKSAS